MSQRWLSALCCIPICLPPTLPSALIKENLPTPHVNFSFTLSPKSLKPIQGGDFFVTILLLFPLGCCHRNPVFDKHRVHLKISPCQVGLNANVGEILASMCVTFQPLFEELFKRPSRGETRKTSLSSWFTGMSLNRKARQKKIVGGWICPNWLKSWKQNAKLSKVLLLLPKAEFLYHLLEPSDHEPIFQKKCLTALN